MRDRKRLLKKELKEKNLDGFIISYPPNLRYLIGYTGDNGLLLLTHKGTVFFTDFRYKEQVKREVRGCRIRIAKKNLFDELAEYNLKGIKRLGFESQYISVNTYKRLARKLKGIKLVPYRDITGELRMVKDGEELLRIRRAARITDSVFKEIIPLIKPGMREKDLALEMEYRLKKRGDGIPFPIIVASGPNSALPHAQPTNRRFKNHDFITLDFGTIYKGYASDFTRTLVLGRASPRQREIYSIVLEAQRRAIEGIRPGIKATVVDGLARDYIKSKGYGEYFGHGLGHGVGLVVHEGPVLSGMSRDILRKDMVATVEPGIYIPRFGGVRIEDLIRVDSKGAEVLTKSTRRLLEL